MTDKIKINGNYQYRALVKGLSPQRFWHYNKLNMAIKQLDEKTKLRVLDAGCGSGVLTYMLSKTPTTEIVAIDTNVNAIKFAQHKFKRPNITFINDSLNKMTLPENSFDAIFLLEVIEHMPKKQAELLLQRFYKILKPDGIIIISTPNKNSMWPIIEFILDKTKIVPPMAKSQHEYLYNHTTLKEVMKNTGFSTKKVTTINAIAPWVAMVNWNLAHKIADIEAKYKINWGNLLLASFRKPKM